MKIKFGFIDDQGRAQKAIETGINLIDTFGVMTTVSKYRYRYIFNNPTKVGTQTIQGKYKKVIERALRIIKEIEP